MLAEADKRIQIQTCLCLFCVLYKYCSTLYEKRTTLKPICRICYFIYLQWTINSKSNINLT